MLPLLFLALAVASDRTGGRKTAFREAPLSTWCRCQGETCSSKKENFGGLLSGLDFLFASEGEKKFRLEMARQSAMSLPAHLSRILKMKPKEGAEFVIKAETWPTYAPLTGLAPIPGPFEEALKALNDPSEPSPGRLHPSKNLRPHSEARPGRRSHRRPFRVDSRPGEGRPGAARHLAGVRRRHGGPGARSRRRNGDDGPSVGLGGVRRRPPRGLSPPHRWRLE